MRKCAKKENIDHAALGSMRQEATAIFFCGIK